MEGNFGNWTTISGIFIQLSAAHTEMARILLLSHFKLQKLKFPWAVSYSNTTFVHATFAICHRPSVCLSSVCNIPAPYSGDWNFPQCFFTIWYV